MPKSYSSFLYFSAMNRSAQRLKRPEATQSPLSSPDGSSYSIHDSAGMLPSSWNSVTGLNSSCYSYSYYYCVNAHSASLASPQRRPNLVKRETDQILSYYQSEHAGRTYDAFTLDDDRDTLRSSLHHRQDSYSSQSSSNYSSDSFEPHQLDEAVHLDPEITGAQLASDSRHARRRSSVPSEGSADRRRLAIVEMDPPSFQINHNKDHSSTSAASTITSDLLSRRGIRVDGLALVAPPDASSKSFTDFTPPSTAPIIPDRIQISSPLPHHHRAASEAVRYQSKGHLPRKSSRDIGIVGTGSFPSASESFGPISPTNEEDFRAYAGSLKPPVFQIPSKSRTPSPGRASAMESDNHVQINQDDGKQSLLSPKAFGVNEVLLTPAIGEGKDVRQPVVGPVVVQLSPDMLSGRQTLAEVPSPATASTPGLTSSPSVYSPVMPSSYRFYEPGVHSIAGPLPPPPIVFDPSERTAPPPRPPRLYGAGANSSKPDIAALKEALQLPKSVSAALASKLSPDLTSTSSPSTPSNSNHEHYRSVLLRQFL